MSTLLAPTIWAVVVALTLRTPFPGTRFGFWGYVLTMTINEVPLLFLVVTSAGMLFGVGDRPGGVAGLAWLALWAFVLAGLLWVQARACRARPALVRALAAELGTEWRAAIRPDLRGAVASGTPWWSGMLLPFQRRVRGVERTRDVPYGPDPAHRLDVYRGSAPGGPRPILIHFHEGGFVQGNKSRETVALLTRLASYGWLCLSANYRLRDAAAWPNPLLDAKRVIAWAREHARDHGADAEHVVLVGGSAGGHLALNAALTPGEARFQPGFEDADTSVSAAVSLYGYLGTRSTDPAGGPAGLAGPTSPPILLIHGGSDSVLPARTARRWAAALRSASGAPVVYAQLPGAQHAFDMFASVRARTCAQEIEAFLDWVRSRPGQGSRRGATR